MKNILGNTILNIVLLIFLPIVGLITMWIFTGWNIIVKIIVSIVMSAYIVAIFNYIMGLIS